MPVQDSIADLIGEDEKCYTIKRIFDNDNNLSLVQILNSKSEIYKVLFYDECERLSSMSIYNPESGREIKGITYKSDGKTISSVRDYDIETEKLLSVTFYRSDGAGVSSIIEYNDTGTETQFTLFEESGQVSTKVI